MLSDLAPIPRRPFAVVCGLGACVSIGLGLLIASSMGGDSQVLMSVGFALAVGAAMCLVPMAGPPLVTPERWGLVVMGVSATRTMAMLGVMLLLLEAQGLPRKPVVYGVLAGTFVMMIAEAAIAVWLLGKREQTRMTLKQQKHVSSTEISGSGSPGSVA